MNIDENSYYWQGNFPYLPNDLRNGIFNEIFREDVAYENTKSHKKSGFYPLFKRYFFQKTSGPNLAV